MKTVVRPWKVTVTDFEGGTGAFSMWPGMGAICAVRAMGERRRAVRSVSFMPLD